MKYLLSIFLLSLSLLYGSAQDFKVAKFDHNRTDLSARTNPRVDGSGQLCALLKVLVMDDIVEVQGNVMGDIISKGVEKWIYVSDHTKQIRLLFKNHFPLMLTFADYGYPVVTEQMTYEVKIVDSGVGESSAKDSPSSTTTPAYDPVSEAIRAYENEDYSKAMELFNKYPNDKEVQYYMAQMYDHGLGVPYNIPRAQELYQKSAKQGFAKAQYKVGADLWERYEIKEALKWLLPSAEQANKDAQFLLGVIYENPNDEYQIERDYYEATKWYELSAQNGHPMAAYSLGEIYRKGFGNMEDEDWKEAIKWYEKSAKGGFDLAQWKMGNYYYDEKNYPEAVKWWKLCAEQGYQDAQSILGHMYYDNENLPRDYKEAFKWFSMVMPYENEAAYSHAQFYIAEMYWNGWGVEQDREEALNHYRISARGGEKKARVRLEELGYGIYD
ncbi:MAG: SEL1-like repeat protein [Muribaculaceae bacterium]|nr:SEL1-like repeat protein [Muribaculaceae bacterium]